MGGLEALSDIEFSIHLWYTIANGQADSLEGAHPGRNAVAENPQTDARAAVGELVGALWFIGWLFTVAYAQLVWWQSMLALVIWPYYLGVAAR